MAIEKELAIIHQEGEDESAVGGAPNQSSTVDTYGGQVKVLQVVLPAYAVICIDKHVSKMVLFETPGQSLISRTLLKRRYALFYGRQRPLRKDLSPTPAPN